MHHRRGLRRLLRDDGLLARIERAMEDRDPGIDELGPKRAALVAYALKLTREPRAMVRADVESLRAVGFTDRDVLQIAELVGYYAYVNRIADGLGVELEGGSEA